MSNQKILTTNLSTDDLQKKSVQKEPFVTLRDYALDRERSITRLFSQARYGSNCSSGSWLLPLSEDKQKLLQMRLSKFANGQYSKPSQL